MYVYVLQSWSFKDNNYYDRPLVFSLFTLNFVHSFSHTESIPKFL